MANNFFKVSKVTKKNQVINDPDHGIEEFDH